MEKCIGYKERFFKGLNVDSLSLGMCLMHCLQIAHFGIKPDNIMFSESLVKLVNISFGLNEITEFTVGKKKVQFPFVELSIFATLNGTKYYTYDRFQLH